MSNFSEMIDVFFNGRPAPSAATEERLRAALKRIMANNPRKVVSSPNGSKDQYIEGMCTQWEIDADIARSALNGT